MRQAKAVFSILKLDVVMNPPVFNNCAGSLAWIWPVWRAKIMHVVFYETGWDTVTPPGNQAGNGENKLQPVAMGGPGLLDNLTLK